MRMTRAALRAQAPEDAQFIHEDADADSFHTSPDSDATLDLERRPLEDITTETNPSTSEDPFTNDRAAPMKKAKSTNTGKKVKKVQSAELVLSEQAAAFGETMDHNQTPSSDESLDSKTFPAGDLVGNEQFRSMSSMTPRFEDKEQQFQDSTSTPQQPCPSAPKTPKFNPSVHKATAGMTSPVVDTSEDSFVEKITSRTPGKIPSFQEERKSPEIFFEEMSSRTTRIEDSVEAIDALEDAIEKVAETLPAMNELQIEFPAKLRKKTPIRLNLPTEGPESSKKPVPTPSRSQRLSPAKTRLVTKAADRPKPSIARQSTAKAPSKPVATAKPIKKPIIDGHKPRQSTLAAAAPSLTFSNSPAKSLPNINKKRVPSENLSTSKPAFVPLKSTKAPTKSTFQLPSEAISAKVKAQREERLKREEEAEKERKVFKARPVPTKVARPSVAPRENKVSNARMSIYANGINKENVAPKPNIPVQHKPRPSSLDPKPKTSELAAARANSSVRRTTSTTAVISKPRVSSINLTAGHKSAVSKVEVIQQKAKGKEVFGRTKAELDRAEQERKEKEAATRKARAEAAERGRQASREWAEKHKNKITTHAKDKVQATAAAS